MEDKRKFVEMLNQALIECGDGRYDRLKDDPVLYMDGSDGIPKGLEILAYDKDDPFTDRHENVSMNSLPAILRAYGRIVD